MGSEKNENRRMVPLIRFKGFTDAWEQRKLGELVSRVKSYPLSRDVETNKNTGYRYIHYGDIHTRVANLVTDTQQVPNIKPGHYDLLEKGDVILADASEDYEDIAAPAVLLTTNADHVVSGLHTIALRPNDEMISLYLYFLIKSPNFREYGRKQGQGLKVFGISTSKVLSYKFPLPATEEQTLISNTLFRLTEAIALHQRKLDLLQKMKKGYLQKLFPKNGEKRPEMRFAGFTDAWEQRKLGTILSERCRHALYTNPISSKSGK
jgi:type I restriction enzyme S subunit